jgi:hypothetical protein
MDSMKRVSWVNLGLGIWLTISPLALQTTGISATNSVLAGLLVIAIAILSLRTSLNNHVPAWINLALGFWVFFSPWLLHVNSQTPVLVKSALTGTLIMIFALARASASSNAVGSAR